MLTLSATLYALAMLALVLGLIMGLGWALRTYGTRWGLGNTARTTPTLRVTERLPLSAQHTLVKVQDGQQEYTLALSPQGVQVITPPNVLPATPKRQRKV
jgi:flagellar biogenesis protein FliO